MFTGIVTTTGRITRVTTTPKGIKVTIKPEFALNNISVGDSVAVDGVCLTVEEMDSESLIFYLSEETLKVTKFRCLIKPGYRANLEPPITPTSFLSGHLVTGHVDTIGKITKITQNQEITRMEILLNSKEESKFIVKKGSVAIDGVSLTVNDVHGLRFGVLLIPHTLKVTNLCDRRTGDPVNIEFDLIAKYVLKMIEIYQNLIRR